MHFSPTIKTSSLEEDQAMSDSSSPVGQQRKTLKKHKHSSSDPPPNISLTPPPKFHYPSLVASLSSSSLSPSDGPSRLGTSGLFSRGRTSSLHSDHRVKISPPSSRDTSVDSRSSTDTDHSWRKYFSPRTWKTTPTKKEARVTTEQAAAYLRTKSRVDLALKAVSDITRIGLEVVRDTGELVPVPGLGAAATLLLNIWDAINEVGSNRLGCLRLTERCANFLLAIYDEVRQRGERVAAELNKPLKELTSSFQTILDLMEELKDQPFWKQWLNRDDIQAQIDRCNQSLDDCLVIFNISIITHILGSVSTAHQSADAAPAALWKGSQEGWQEGWQSAGELDEVDEELSSKLPRFSSSPPIADDLALTDAERIRDRLRALQAYQNELDKAADMNDLRGLLTTALDAPSDRDMQKVLQVAGKDMPKAIRTLLGALEGQAPRKPTPSPAMRSAKHFPHTRSFTWPLDEKQSGLLTEEQIESDVTRLQRPNSELPSWTVNKADISFQDLIGRGFFSNVYKGTWRHRAVAVKVLEPSTQREVFLSEIAIWKSLRHPNILRLYGASDPQQDVPWFLVSSYMKNGTLTEYLKRLEWDGSMLKGASMVSEVYGDSSEPDLLRFMLEIASAMEYLHSVHVIHGDLKGANVLLDNDLRCVLTDFGHSKLTSQISFKNPKQAHGLRWQSPELMSETMKLLSKENDVYAFAITCVEIVTMGSLPWPMLSDDVVKKIVLEKNGRPPYPSKTVDRLGIRHLLDECWDNEFNERPTFSVVVKQLEVLMNGLTFYRSPSPTPPQQPVPLPKTQSDPQEIHRSGGSDPSSSRPRASESVPAPSRSNTLRPPARKPQGTA